MDPVTAMRICSDISSVNSQSSNGTASRRVQHHRRHAKGPANGRAFRSPELVERVPAGARAAGVRVVDREALLLDGVDEVDRRTGEVGLAHLVDDDVHAAEVLNLVAVNRAVVEVELVTQTGAATGLHRYSQREVGTTLLLKQRLHLGGGMIGNHDPSDASLNVTDASPGVSDTGLGVGSCGGVALSGHRCAPWCSSWSVSYTHLRAHE